MTAPHYISDDKSDMRGIKPGWYAIEDDGDLSAGPFSSHEECVKRITQLTNGDGVQVATRAALKDFSTNTSGVEGGVRMSNRIHPLKD